MSSLDAQAEPIEAADLDSYRDATWALRDPQVQHQFEGKWVVAYQGRIIAHGTDPGNVIHEANRLVGDRKHRVVFCAPEDPSSWVEDDAAADAELASG